MSRRTPPPRPVRRTMPKVPTGRDPCVAPRRSRSSAPSAQRARTAEHTLRTSTRHRRRGRPVELRRRRRGNVAPSRPVRPTGRRRGAIGRRPTDRSSVVASLAEAQCSATARSSRGSAPSAFRLRLLLVVLLVVLGAVLFRVAKIQSAGGEAAERRCRAVGAHDAAAGRSRHDLRSQRRGARHVGAGFRDQRQPEARRRRGGHSARCCSRCSGSTTSRRANCTTTWSPRRPGSGTCNVRSTSPSGEQIADLRLAGVNVDAEDKRVLPGGDTGRSVIGRTDIDGVGTAGLEAQYDELLTGTAR